MMRALTPSDYPLSPRMRLKQGEMIAMAESKKNVMPRREFLKNTAQVAAASALAGLNLPTSMRPRTTRSGWP